MERLAQRDRAAGGAAAPLTDEQKTAIAEARQLYQSRVAEREILHHAALRKAGSHEEVDQLNEALRRDMDRLATDRDRKIAQIRGEKPQAADAFTASSFHCMPAPARSRHLRN